jgi:hypothetical protein
LTYRVIAELFDDVDGLLAALMLVSLTWFRTCSTMVASRIPAMLLGLLATWAWLQWRRNHDWRWAGRHWRGLWVVRDHAPARRVVFRDPDRRRDDC